MRQYIALIHKDAGSDYGVSFPDLPGCVTAGVDLDDARRMAEEALALHLAGMAEDAEPIPEPSSLEAVMAERENREAVAILVKAPPATAKAVRVNMTLPEDELELIDKFAAEQGYTRSGFLLHAAKQAMERGGEVSSDVRARTDRRFLASEIAATVNQVMAVAYRMIASDGDIERLGETQANIAEDLGPPIRHRRVGSAQQSRRQSEKAAPAPKP
jgi:predicted RNase H-like HicB family nuclease